MLCSVSVLTRPRFGVFTYRGEKVEDYNMRHGCGGQEKSLVSLAGKLQALFSSPVVS